MIILDKRAGSIELEQYLRVYDCDVELGILDAADVSFWGCGPEDSTVKVGVEVKKVSDFVNSMRDKRLSGSQLNGLCRDYDYAWIVIIGPWRSGDHGEMVYLRGREWRTMSDGTRSVLYSAINHYSTTLRLKAGTEAGNVLQIERVCDNREAAAFIAGLYSWFQKPWELHRSHEAIYNREYRPGKFQKAFIRRKVRDCERYVAVADGFDTIARFVADKFGSIREVADATVEEIASTPVEQRMKDGSVRVVKLGMKKGEKLWKSLRSTD